MTEQDNAPPPNPELRTHVQETAFVLSLRKTHIAFLIAVALNERSHVIRDMVSPGKGLKERGLMFHYCDIHGRTPYGEPQPTWLTDNERKRRCRLKEELHQMNDFYRLTKAGWLVYDLLVEAGMATPVPLRGRKVLDLTEKPVLTAKAG